MPVVSKVTLKGYFENGKVPAEAEYVDLIDTMGDMSKSEYDSDLDSKVENADAADTVPWTGITGKPSSFTPSLHNTTHKSGGTDSIRLDEFAAPIDVTTLNASISAHGLLKKLSNVSTQFLNGLGNWIAVAWTDISGKPSSFTPAAHDHGSTYHTGLSDDDHTQYYNQARGDARYFLKDNFRYLLPFTAWEAVPGVPITSSTTLYVTSIGVTGTVDRWIMSYLNQSPSDGSNYWSIKLSYSPSATIISTQNITSYTGSWRQFNVDLNYEISTAGFFLGVVATKVGNPGSLYLASPWVEYALP